MSEPCKTIHGLFNKLKIYCFPFDKKEIPKNGVYILFEKGEKGHGTKRIVRVGTHTGKDQLLSRLMQHFVNENKDRSIFRKNIGRAILNKNKDSFLKKWDLDLTTRKARELHEKSIDFKKQKKIEEQVTHHIRTNFSFVIIPVNNKKQRLELESEIISSVSHCNKCGPSKKWLGNISPKEKIRKSGLWQVNELYKECLSKKDFKFLKTILLQK